MKLKNFVLLGALCSIFAFFTSCEEPERLGLPKITISTFEMEFGIDGGEQELTLNATRNWRVETDADWLVLSQESGAPLNEPLTLTVTTLANMDMSREAKVKFTIDMISKYLIVKQKGPLGSPEDLIVYNNDFDKEVAGKTYGSGSSWPYLDQFAGWQNEKGTGIAAVNYKFKSASARASSNNNNIWLPKTGAYFSIQDIALNGSTSFKLSFKTICGSTGTYKGTFNKDILKVYLSADKAKWYDLPYNLTVEEGFDSAETTFSVPAGTESLSICFEKIADEVDGYRVDAVDLSLYDGAPATAVDFTAGIDKSFDEGSTGSGSGSGSGSTVETPANAIFFESFASRMGNFTLNEVSVPSGLSAVWEYSSSYSCMKATAYVNATQQNLPSESWLISPEIDLTSQTAAYLTFEHAGGYFENASADATLWISKDGGSWTQLTIAPADYPTSWSFISAGKWDLASYVGSKIKIAFKYMSSATKAGTWEVRNVAVIADAIQAEPEPELPTMPEGETCTITTNSGLTWTSDSHATYGDGFTVTSNGVKLAFYKHTSTTDLNATNQFKSDHTRIYKGSALVVSLENGKPIKYILIKATAKDYSKPFTVVSGKGPVAQDGTELIWAGEHESPFIAELTGGQIRMKEITIVY